jgi:hypothetical protein
MTLSANVGLARIATAVNSSKKRSQQDFALAVGGVRKPGQPSVLDRKTSSSNATATLRFTGSSTVSY